MVVLIPPRGEISNPQYYAHGPDIPRALEAVEAARRTSGVLDQELDAQLVGLARLVVDPGRAAARSPASRSITVASDLHNNTFGVDVLERAGRRRPGVLRRRPDRPRLAVRDAARAARGADGQAVRVRLGQPRLRLPLARAGARGRDRAHAQRPARPRRQPFGPVINKINDLRVAGYDDPYERRMAESFADRYDAGAGPGRAGAVPGLAAAADRQGRRRDGPRAGADRDRPGGPARRPAGAAARVPRRPHAQAPIWRSCRA